jgi:hypothetical protein
VPAASARDAEMRAAAQADEALLSLRFGLQVSVVDATLWALSGLCRIHDVPVATAIRGLGMGLERPRVLRPKHLGAAFATALAADESVFHKLPRPASARSMPGHQKLSHGHCWSPRHCHDEREARDVREGGTVATVGSSE